MAKRLYSQEETKKKFEALPREIQNLLYSFEMTSIITKIGEKHGLHVDQMDSLNSEAAQVMLGLTNVREFSQILMEDLSVDEAKANAIASDVNGMLFVKVRELLQQPSLVESAPSPKSSLAEVLPKESISSAPSVPLIPKEDMHPADIMLNEKTISTAPRVTPAAPPLPSTPLVDTKAVPPKPQEYKADPYREPTI